MTENAYTPNQRTEQGRVQSLGSGGRASESDKQGIAAMRRELSAAATRGEAQKVKRIKDNLALVEKRLGK